MKYYEILGVDENASKEEIQKAYESRLNKVKAEVTNERRMKLFAGALNEAYEALMKDIQEKEAITRSLNNDDDNLKTLVIDSKELQGEIEKQQVVYEERKRSSSKKKSSSKGSGSGSSKNRDKSSYWNDNNKNKNDEESKKEKESKKDKENKEYDDQKNKKNIPKKVVVESEKNIAKSIFNLLMLPLKILALPIIAVLSILFIICKIINLVSWIASKVIIVGGIAIGSIHLYQIHMGQAPNKNLLVLVAIAIIASFFLPYILRVIPKTLGAVNDILKGFVFN